jgi:hypothetical protein
MAIAKSKSTFVVLQKNILFFKTEAKKNELDSSSNSKKSNHLFGKNMRKQIDFFGRQNQQKRV